MSRSYYKSYSEDKEDENLIKKINKIENSLFDSYILNYYRTVYDKIPSIVKIFSLDSSSFYRILKYDFNFNFKKDDLIIIFFECPFRYDLSSNNGAIQLNLDVAIKNDSYYLSFYDRIDSFNPKTDKSFFKYSFILTSDTSFISTSFYLYNNVGNIKIYINKRDDWRYNFPSFEINSYRKF